MRQVGDRFDVAGKSMMLNDASLDDVDPEISELIAQEKHRQVRGACVPGQRWHTSRRPVAQAQTHEFNKWIKCRCPDSS